NAYITGYTGSTDFPTQNPLPGTSGGGNDAFVTKLNAAGSALVYSTRLGGSGYDAGYGIAVDGAGNAHVAGDTGSPDFPTKNPFQGTANGSDAFVAVISTPSLAWQGPSYTWTQTAAANPSVTPPADQSNTEGDNVSLPLQASDPN